MKDWYQHGYHNPLSLRLIFGIIPRLPKWIHPPIAVMTALIFFCLLGTEREAVIRNLRRVCRVGRAHLLWKAYRVFYSFCDLMVSYCYVPRASHAELCSMLAHPDRGAATIDRCLSSGNGLIVWTAHIGNWEFASRLLEMHGRPVNVARAVEAGNTAEVMLRDMMTHDGLRIVAVNEDVFASVELLRALRQNEIVAIQGDRAYQRHNGEVPFFGERAVFPLGPFFLSYISGAPVLPGIVVRDGWLRYRVVMGEPIELAHTGERDRDLIAGLQQAIRFLEDVIVTYHCQWLNFYGFWSPPGSEGERAGAVQTATSQV
jgi:KDO2-lipid IV(A) lauroyltransferase